MPAAAVAAMAASSSRLMAFWNHPAGPKTIHFWAPTFKWGITLANIADFWRPADRISYPQQCAVTATGIIWSRFSTQITPVRPPALLRLAVTVSGLAVPGRAVLCCPVHYLLQPNLTAWCCAGELQPVDGECFHGRHWHLPAQPEAAIGLR